MSDPVCQLCGREAELTFHHLVPRTLRRRKWFKRNLLPEDFLRGAMLCRPCHKAVHAFIDEPTLGRSYNTLDALRQHRALCRFVEWVKTQDPGGRVRVDQPLDRR